MNRLSIAQSLYVTTYKFNAVISVDDSNQVTYKYIVLVVLSSYGGLILKVYI